MRFIILTVALMASPALGNDRAGERALDGYPVEKQVRIPINDKSLIYVKPKLEGCPVSHGVHPCDPRTPGLYLTLDWASPVGEFAVSRFQGSMAGEPDIKRILDDARTNGGVVDGVLRVKVTQFNMTAKNEQSQDTCYRTINETISLDIPKYKMHFAGLFQDGSLGGHAIKLPPQPGACAR